VVTWLATAAADAVGAAEAADAVDSTGGVTTGVE
jgi:hypothetical protein